MIEIHGLGRTEFLACPALTVLEINAVVMIDSILQGNGLGIFHIGGLAFSESGVVGVHDFFGTLLRTFTAGDAFGFINISGTLNKLYLKRSCLAPDLFYLTQCF